MTNTKSKRYVYLVSDATGLTCKRVVFAALDQFRSTQVTTKLYAEVLSENHINKIIKEAVKKNGIIIYTFCIPEMRNKITELGRLNGVPTVDIMGPLLTRLSDLLEISPLAKPGLKNQLDQDYFNRIDAIDYTIKHDDGLGLSTIDKAEIILIGVSRTTKTPVSIYLSYRGWKVANIPIIPEMGLPLELEKMDNSKVIALSMKPIRLSVIRMERQSKLASDKLADYADPDRIRFEINDTMRMYRKKNYVIINVTNKSIEETSTEIMRIIYANTKIKKGRIIE